MDSIKDHFKMRAERYDNAKSSWVHNKEILNIIKDYVDRSANDNCRLLEIGAGTGIVSKYLCNNCTRNLNVTALDISEDMIKNVCDPRIRTVVSEIEKMPFDDNAYDIIVSRQCLHYISDIKTAINQVSRVLSNNGIFILSQIVPYSKKTKEYWEKIIRFRQPLRYNFFTGDEWIDFLMMNRFILEDCKMSYHWASIWNWVYKYNIQDENLIRKYKSLYISAPESFKEEYDVKISDEDIISKSYWINIMMRNKKY